MAQNRQYVAELLLKLEADTALAQARSELRALQKQAADAEGKLGQTLAKIQERFNGLVLRPNLDADDVFAEAERLHKVLKDQVRSSGDFAKGYADARAYMADLRDAMVSMRQASLDEPMLKQNVTEAKVAALDAQDAIRQAKANTRNEERAAARASAAEERRLAKEEADYKKALAAEVKAREAQAARDLAAEQKRQAKEYADEQKRLDAELAARERERARQTAQRQREMTKLLANAEKEAAARRAAEEAKLQAEIRAEQRRTSEEYLDRVREEAQAARNARLGMETKKGGRRRGVNESDYQAAVQADIDAQMRLERAEVAAYKRRLEAARDFVTAQQTAYDSAVRAQVNAAQEVADANQAVQHLGTAAARKTLAEKQKALSQWQAEAGKAAQSVASAEARAAEAARQYGKATAQAAQQAEKSHLKTTLASQNVIRIIQDMPYGMMGITNNIQAMGESIAYMTTQINTATGRTYTFGEAMRATFKSLLTGPMAISLVITLLSVLVMQADKIGDAWDKARIAFGNFSREAQRTMGDLEKAGKSMADGLVEDLSPAELEARFKLVAGLADDAQTALEEATNSSTLFGANMGMALNKGILSLSKYGTGLGILSRNAREVVDASSEVAKEFKGLSGISEGLRDKLRDLNAIKQVVTDLYAQADAAAAAAEKMRILTAANKMAFGSFEDLLREGGRKMERADALSGLEGDAREREEVMQDHYDRMLAIDDKYRDALDKAKAQRDANAAMPGTSAYQEAVKTIERINAQMASQWRESEAERDEQLRKLGEKRSEEAEQDRKDAAKMARLIEELRIDAMRDGIEKRLALVHFEFQERIDAVDREVPGWQKAVEGLESARTEALRREQITYRQEVADSAQRVLALRAEAAEADLAARVAQMRDTFEAERAELLGMQTINDAKLESERAALAVRLENLREAGTLVPEVEREIQAEIEAIDAKRRRVRAETERAVTDSYRNEADAVEDAASRQMAMLDALAEAEADLKRKRRERVRGDEVDYGLVFQGRDPQRDDEEYGIIKSRREREAAINKHYRDLELEGTQEHLDALKRAELIYEAEMDEARARSGARRVAEAKRLGNIIIGLTNSMVSNLADAATTEYETWRSVREAELEDQGYTEEERAKILEREGAKQFEEQKKLQIASAWINGLQGAVAAFAAAAPLGPIAGPIVGAANAAAVMLLTKKNVDKIKSMKPGGNASGGGSAPSYSAGAWASLNDEMASERVAGFETWRSAGGFSQTPDPFSEAAERMERAVGQFEEASQNMTAQVSAREAGAVVRGGYAFNELTNGNR